MLEKLGSGSFGTIRRVVRKSDKKVLVWKEIRYGRMSEKEKSMLVSEVNILRELKHPNIVRYKDRIIDRESSTIYIIMEFCENGDLSSVIRKYKRSGKRMEESRIWSLFFQLSCALHECHSRKLKILHRDIKPANVFIDKHQLFKLGDFGLARILSSDTQLAKTNVGTPYYMAPEQVNELPYNEKCDIWSMGCLIYEMAALAPPFEAANQLALAVKIKAGRVARLPEGYSDELNSAVRSMLQLEPPKRPSIEELFKLPRMQEQAELAVKAAQAVPALYMDRYFGQQLRRLQAKEDEIAQRAQDLVTKEKNLRGGKATDDDKLPDDLKRREDDLRRREEKLEADFKARAAALEAEARGSLESRETALKAREDEVLGRERGATDKERKLEKAKSEYHVLYAELKKRKKALDDQLASLTTAKLAVADAASAADAEKTHTALPGKAPHEAMDWVGMGAAGRAHKQEAFARRHSCSDVPTSPRRAAPGETKETAGAEDAMTARAKNMRAQAQHAQATAACGVRAEVKQNNVLQNVAASSEPRSPTPHPRHGTVVDRDGQERQLEKLVHIPKDKENMNPQQQHLTRRQSSEANTKRQAIYGVLFGKRATSAAAPSEKVLPANKDSTSQANLPPSTADSDEEGDDIAPIRLNGRRMFAMPAGGQALNDSLDH